MTHASAVVSAEETISGPSGLGLHVRTWRPAGPPRAVLVVCHGFNSHSGQYRWVGEQFANAGFAVTAADLRGRGQSEGERFYVADVADYVADLALAVARAKARDPGLPTFLLGHSAGGVVSGVYCLDHQEQLAGFICESFAFRVPAPRPALAAIKGLSRLAPRLGVLRLKPRDFSRIPEAVAALEADPFTAGETQPASTVAALVRADERLEREFPRLTLPVLILHGSHDRATLPQGSRMFHAATGSADKTLRIYEGHFHDLLNDLGREDVLADILGWIEARLVPA